MIVCRCECHRYAREVVRPSFFYDLPPEGPLYERGLALEHERGRFKRETGMIERLAEAPECVSVEDAFWLSFIALWLDKLYEHW